MPLWDADSGGHNDLYPPPRQARRRSTATAPPIPTAPLRAPLSRIDSESKDVKNTSSQEGSSTSLFSSSLISKDVIAQLPEGYIMRPLATGDYKAGHLETLKSLTTVGEVSEQQWLDQYEWMRNKDGYYVLVVCDGGGTCVGTGSVVVERKFIHNLGSVGHIEDIVVRKDQQGKKLGLRIIEALDHIAQLTGCYKTILDCSETNEGFYVKCGYKRVGLEMAHYYENGKPKV